MVQSVQRETYWVSIMVQPLCWVLGILVKETDSKSGTEVLSGLPFSLDSRFLEDSICCPFSFLFLNLCILNVQHSKKERKEERN